MSRRGDNIHKRKDGRWEGRYKDPHRPNINKYLSVYARTYTECKAKLESAKSYISIKPESKNTKIQFSEVLELWMLDNAIRLKKSTQTKYRYMINKYIKPELGELQLEKLNSIIVNDFLNKMLLCGSKKGLNCPLHMLGH